MENKFYIYFHINPQTKKVFYVGKGSGKRAWSKNRNNKWKNYVAKYGYEVEIFEDGLTEEEALAKEIEYIALYGKDRLVNQRDGGQSGWGYKHTDETRKKLSEIFKGRKLSEETIQKLKAYKHTDEARKKISEAQKGKPSKHKGKKLSEEARKKISNSLIGNKRSLGRKLSEEHKRKLSESMKNHFLNK